jgi:hypothetical protein
LIGQTVTLQIPADAAADDLSLAIGLYDFTTGTRLTLDDGQRPHWISLAPDGERIVISGGGETLQTLVLMARIDRESGRLTLDDTFRDRGAAQPGVSFDRLRWPHGDSGRAIPHGAVFSRDKGDD